MRGWWRGQRLNRAQNLVIAALICSALFLVGKTGMFDSVIGTVTDLTGGGTVTGLPDMSLSRGTPVGLLIQTSQGRYGVQYDQNTADRLYAGGLEALLTQALVSTDRAQNSSLEAWQQAVSQAENWVCYDFQYNVSFSNRDNGGKGAARTFLVTARGGRADALYYYNQETSDYFSCRIKDTGITLPALMGELTPNGGQFAFELPSLRALPGLMLVLPQAPSCPVYTASNPLQNIETADQQSLLETLEFNIRAASIYQAADGTVIQEGADTLRLQKSGILIFHGTETGEARYQALSAREKDLQIKAEEILDNVAADWLDQGRMVCQKISTAADGSVELTFCTLLNGAPVRLWGEDWSARFVFRGSDLTAFELRLRQYTQTEETCVLMPLRQAAAAAAALEQTGKELQLSYEDDGTGPVNALWTVRETG